MRPSHGCRRRSGRSSLASELHSQALAERILSSKSALEGERKQVTVLFADLKGSMELLADRDPEEARKLLDPVLERMTGGRPPLRGHRKSGDGRRYNGAVWRAARARGPCGEGLLCGIADAGNGQALRRQACQTGGVPLHIRVGVNSGEVVVRSIGSDLHMDYTAVGQTTHVAARLEQMAIPASISSRPRRTNLWKIMCW